MATIISVTFLVILVTTLYTAFRGAPFVGINDKALVTILKFAKPQKGDVVVDLGSGDGRVLVQFANNKNVHIHGYEINPILALVSWLKVKRHGLEDKAHIHLRNFWSVDLKEFDVIVVFGISYIMSKLEKKIKKEAKQGTRVLSYSYPLPSLTAQREKDGVYLYKI